MVKLIRLFTVKREKAINIRAWHPILFVSIERTPHLGCTMPGSVARSLRVLIKDEIGGPNHPPCICFLVVDKGPVIYRATGDQFPKDHTSIHGDHQKQKFGITSECYLSDEMAPWGLQQSSWQRLLHKGCLRSMERMICIVLPPEHLCHCLSVQPQIKL